MLPSLKWSKMMYLFLTNISCLSSFYSPLKSLLKDVMVSRAVPEGFTDNTMWLFGVWKPSSLYLGRICVTSHRGSQYFQPGAALMVNPLGPPISCLFSTAIASRFLIRGLSQTSKLSNWRTSHDILIRHWVVLKGPLDTLPASFISFILIWSRYYKATLYGS